MNKKEWLDHLYYDIGKQQYDFELCGMKKEGDKITTTKWVKYSKLIMPLNSWDSWKIDWVNNRTILPNEIVLDIEEKNKLKEVVDKLYKYKFLGWNVYDTGSRGYHIHLYFADAISKKTKEFFIREFGADMTKSGDRVMIALENCPHWKTGKIKKMIK